MFIIVPYIHINDLIILLSLLDTYSQRTQIKLNCMLLYVLQTVDNFKVFHVPSQQIFHIWYPVTPALLQTGSFSIPRTVQLSIYYQVYSY